MPMGVYGGWNPALWEKDHSMLRRISTFIII